MEKCKDQKRHGVKEVSKWQRKMVVVVGLLKKLLQKKKKSMRSKEEINRSHTSEA